MSSALIVDSDPVALEQLSVSLATASWTIVCATTGQAALREIERRRFSVIVAAGRLPDLGGFDLVSAARSQEPRIGVVLLSDDPGMRDAVRAGRIGALVYLAKPFMASELRSACTKAIQESSREGAFGSDFYGLIGTSVKMREVFRQIAVLAPLPYPVLIRGETGTGKELVARAIHAVSKVSGPFVAANVAAFAPTLVEDALFGHERGAFTGADSQREGLFEQARAGTVFLDEIGELEPALQVKLLRVIDTRQLSRLGSVAERGFDARIVAATNVDLEAAQKEGRFRPDLFYRLRQVEIHLPPLRERWNDLDHLIEHYLKKVAQELARPALTVSTDTFALLRAYGWPGNVRELESVLRRAAVAATSSTIEREDLPLEVAFGNLGTASLPDRRPPSLSLNDAIAEATSHLERRWIAEALRESGGNIGTAATSLGIDPKTLYEKRRRYGLLSTSDGRKWIGWAK
jgi:two-component system, NtrC family, response regulator AtoC